MPSLQPKISSSNDIYSMSCATSEVVRQLRRILKLQRLGIYLGSALLVMKAHAWIGFYAIGVLVFVPIALGYVKKKIFSELKRLVENIRGVRGLIKAQAHVIQTWQEFKILHRQLKLVDAPLEIRFDQYIEDQYGEYWHISSNGHTLNIKPLNSSVLHILKKRWKQ